MTYTWPIHYPSNCPPDPHTELVGNYYRLVYCNILRKRDFLSRYERNKKEDTCLKRSISLFSEIQDAKSILLQYPKFRYRYIAKIHLPGKHGIIHKTSQNNNSHHEWWIPINIDPMHYSCNSITGPY